MCAQALLTTRSTITKDFLYVIDDALFLKIIAPACNLNFVAWYISALIVESFLLFIVLDNFDSKIVRRIFSMAALIFFGVIREWGHPIIR